MSSNYTGDPSNVTTPISAGVISCSSGSGGLVLVQTSTSHMFATNDTVNVTGVLGTTEANTTTTITVISSDTFLLDGVAFANAYSSGGTAQDLSLTPYFQVPDNGEAATVDSILAAIQCLADRTQYLNIQGKATTHSISYTTAGAISFVVPYGVTSIEAEGFGGGGGSAGGEDGGAGGGGGGGAVARTVIIPVTAGQVLTGIIGAGGTAGGRASNGADGSDTTFAGRIWFGAGQGSAGGACGGPMRGLAAISTAGYGPGYGGPGGALGGAGANGVRAVGSGYATAGLGAAAGGTVAGNVGGGGGGGGGMSGNSFVTSSATTGGDGGAGGAGSAGTGVNGAVGHIGHYGCGGGGGGGGGAGAAFDGQGRTGAAGGTGGLIIRY